MASMLRVVLATCVIFTSFVCGRTLGNNVGDTEGRIDNYRDEEVLHRSRRAPPGIPNAGDMPGQNFGQQGMQQQQPNQGPAAGAGIGGRGGAWQGQGMPAQVGGIGQGIQALQGGQMQLNAMGGQQGYPQGQVGVGNGMQQPGGGMRNFGMNRGQGGGGQLQFQQPQGGQALGGDGHDARLGQGLGGVKMLGKQMAKDTRRSKQQLGQASRQIRIAETEECRDDVLALCGKNARGNNFAVLDCLQNARQDNSDISVGCNHFLWQYKLNLTKDARFDSAAFEVCKDDLNNKFPACAALERGKGLVLPCLYDVLENITNTQCRQYLNRMKAITFSDYRLIQGFYEHCRDDIEAKKCGDVQETKDDDKMHKQGSTIQCLEKKVADLNPECKTQILRVAELAANDYHIDRALYFACKDDRERFCEKQQAGSGRVYKCLLKHKFEKDMSDECKDKLTTRQQVISQDYKANYALQKKCKEEIHRNHCEGKREKDKSFRLSFLLVCLEAAKKRGRRISGECDAELIDTRRSLMSDYLINPEVVFGCRRDIEAHCEGVQREGRTLHCLMERAKVNQGLDPQCIKALEDLVKETDAGEDYRIDPALQRACEEVKQAVCKEETGGDGKVLSCLMEHIYDPKMTDVCETELLQLQYFVSRDFKLDPLLFKNCEADASRLCHAQDWEMDDPSNGIIFACLHRNLHVDNARDALSPGCQAQVHRVLRQRALSVHLNPRIEAECRKDLGELCTDKTKKGEELQCLQQNFAKLTEGCKKMVGNFTTEESEDIRMNRILMQACSPMLKKFCKEKLQNQVDEGEALQCLIDHKDDDDMDKKCAAGVDHFQLIQLNDYRFNFKFKEACRKDVLANCKGSKEKSSIIKCLSERVRDDILQEADHTISEDCRKQLKVELLERSENIQLDPELFNGCESDVTSFCSKIKAGNARVLECLREHKEDLSDRCHRKLFNREKQQAKNPDTDFAFMHACKPMIKQYCTNYSPDQILKCLRSHKNDPAMDPSCKSLITKRQIEKNSDFRLNMELQKACRRDMPKFCKTVLDNSKLQDEKELEGLMLNCLKKQFPKSKLSQECEDYIKEAIEEGAMDYRMDAALNKACKPAVRAHCKEKLQDTGTGSVEECLKLKLQEGKLKEFPLCQTEVIRLLQESRADVQVDPILHKACALDIKHYCVNIPQGEGRHMSCLLEALEDRTIKLRPDCTRMLKERKEMWEFAARVAPVETMEDVIAQLQASPSRNYFLLVFLAIFGTLFFGGMFCGRATKRVAAQLKNK